jgi:hypothetical protein
MKNIFLALCAVSCFALVSCENFKESLSEIVSSLKANVSAGVEGGKTEDGGYEVKGHASTNVLGWEPYVEAKAGIRKKVDAPVEEEVVVVEE